MTSGPVLVLVVAILSGGLALVLGGGIGLIQWLRVRRRGASPGPVRLAGPVEPIDGHSVTAPVAAEPAICYEWRLEREEGRVTRPVWRTVDGGGDCEPFLLDVDGGRVRVEPRTADLDLEDGPAEMVEGPADLPDALADRLDADPDWEGDDRYRLVEARLEAGDRVSVSGHLSIGANGTPTVSGPDAPSLLGRLFGVPFVIADESRDGGAGRLRDRAIAGFVLGVPPTLLALVLLFPPEIAG